MSRTIRFQILVVFRLHTFDSNFAILHKEPYIQDSKGHCLLFTMRAKTIPGCAIIKGPDEATLGAIIVTFHEGPSLSQDSRANPTAPFGILFLSSKSPTGPIIKDINHLESLSGHYHYHPDLLALTPRKCALTKPPILCDRLFGSLPM